jgi:ribosomal protein S27AE
MSALNGRLKALERRADQAAGCPDCGGVTLIGLDNDEPWPSWLDDESRCRRCGNGVKVVLQRYLDKLS